MFPFSNIFFEKNQFFIEVSHMLFYMELIPREISKSLVVISAKQVFIYTTLKAGMCSTEILLVSENKNLGRYYEKEKCQENC
jgi:hypothetical protein